MAKFKVKDKVMEIQKRYLLTCAMLNRLILVVKRVIAKIVPLPVKNLVMSGNDVPDDARTIGFNMCRDSIGGVWANIHEHEFQIKPLSGGLTNYLYLCSLPEGIDVPDNQPRTVLLRVYGDIASKFVVENSVIFALMSEKKLGPKLYGMNVQARLEEYIPTDCLRTSDLSNPTLSRQIAQRLAQFHRLDMPLCKEPRFITDMVDKWIIDVTESLNRNRQPKDVSLVQKFKSYNLQKEWEVLKKILSQLHSPVVFSHNDLQEGNILYFKDCADPDKRLTVIDWEYCSYNYRGNDFGNHFCEWTYDYHVNTFPYYKETPENYPAREQQYEFFKAYLQEMGETITEEKLSDMYEEANTYALLSHFFWGLWSVLQNDMSNIQFAFMDYAEARFQGYFRQKDTLSLL